MASTYADSTSTDPTLVNSEPPASEPNENTYSAQRGIWSTFILDYCRYHRLWRLHVADALETDLFWNKSINRRLKHKDALEIMDAMVKEGRLEWDSPAKTTAIVYWRTPDEWATLLYDWVDSTAQRGSILTLYEIVEGDATANQEFHGIDMVILKKALEVLIKKGQAHMLGNADEAGVKFF